VRCLPEMHDKLSAGVLRDLELEQYPTKMKTVGCWGDGIMITAASLLYDRAVTVVLEDDNRYTVDSELTSKDPLTIGFMPLCGKIPNHFVSLLRSVTYSQSDTDDHCTESSKSASGDGPCCVTQLMADSASFDYEAEIEQTTSTHANERPGEPRLVNCVCCQGHISNKLSRLPRRTFWPVVGGRMGQRRKKHELCRPNGLKISVGSRTVQLERHSSVTTAEQLRDRNYLTSAKMPRLLLQLTDFKTGRKPSLDSSSMNTKKLC